MGRHAGYIALWCGIANGAEDILIPEKYDYDEQKIVDHIIINRRLGKKHHLIINAEGIGHSTSMARRIEAATGIETRATILGYMQRGGSPTCKDRYYASIMGAYAADILVQGKTNRVVCYRNGQFVDLDIEEALAMTKNISEYEYFYMTERITSASNPRVKRLTALGRKAKLRREERVFIIEGERLYTDTPRKYLKEIYMTEEFLTRSSRRRSCGRSLTRIRRKEYSAWRRCRPIQGKTSWALRTAGHLCCSFLRTSRIPGIWAP